MTIDIKTEVPTVGHVACAACGYLRVEQWTGDEIADLACPREECGEVASLEVWQDAASLERAVQA